MKSLYFLAAGAATIGIAAPAAAQYTYPYQAPQQTYPQYQYAQPVPQPYPGQPGYGYQQPGYAYPGQQGQNVIGQMINQLLGNRYQATDRTAVTQCASAAMAQAHARYQPRGYQQNRQGYGYPGYNQGYNQGYNPAAHMRVTAITDVRRLRSGMRVSGLMSSGMHAAYAPYGQAHGYYNQAQSDLSFRCNVARNGRVTDVRVTRNAQQYRR
ncbi:MAG: hypothetical protein ACR2JJ_06375 [Sphingomicrobium sp.]